MQQCNDLSILDSESFLPGAGRLFIKDTETRSVLTEMSCKLRARFAESNRISRDRTIPIARVTDTSSHSDGPQHAT